MLNFNYFNPARTQPFIITLFMAIMAFRRLCKRMRQARQLKNRQLFPSHSKSMLQAVMKRSQRNIYTVLKGKSVMNPNDIVPTTELAGVTVASSLTGKGDQQPPMKVRQSTYSGGSTKICPPKRARNEELFRNVARQVASFHMKLHQDRAIELEERLENLVGNEKDDVEVPVMPASVKRSQLQSRSKSSSRSALRNNYFQHFAAPLVADEVDEHNTQQLEVGEYLEGTSIYFGATIALQARHGGFLSCGAQEVKASAHKIMNHSRFIVKKSDDLTDIGAVCYGDALWLQAGPTTVLGARYGSLVDQKRAIQPALISCKRQNMFKANQYGRWIILNREDPMGTLGNMVGHFDRIILEQEWYFLASSSPYESSMYKSLNNSDEAMTTKIDLFRPTDECVWKLHLVALPSDDKEDERQRQQLLQDAKDQIDRSEQLRYQKSSLLLNSLSNSLPSRLRDDVFVNTKLRHKTSLKGEQEHFMDIYRKLSKREFSAVATPAKFLGNIYGYDSPIVTMRRRPKSHSPSPSPKTKPPLSRKPTTFLTSMGDTKEENAGNLEGLESEYWDAAQKILIKSHVWSELPQVMETYEDIDADKKLKAALVLQKWMKKGVEARFNFNRAMKKVDQKAHVRLEEKAAQRRQLLMEHEATMELAKRELAKQALLVLPVNRSPPKGYKSGYKATSTHVKSDSILNRRKSTEGLDQHAKSTLDAVVVAAVAKEIIDSDNPLETLTNVPAQPRAARSLSFSMAMSPPDSMLHLDQSQSGNAEVAAGVAQLTKNFTTSILPSFGSNQLQVPVRISRPVSASALPSATESRSIPYVRPSTASGSFGNEKKNSHLEMQKDLLIRTAKRDYGLPEDVFCDMKDETNIAVGLKFLRAMSANPDIYNGIKAKKRENKTVRSKSATPQNFTAKEKRWNPVSSSRQTYNNLPI